MTYHLMERKRLGPHEVLMSLAEEEVDLLVGANELLFPESVHLIVQQLNERDDEAPRMRAANDDALEENAADTLGNSVWDFGTGGGAEDEEHEGDEEEGVRGRVAELIGDSREQVVLSLVNQQQTK